MSHLFYHPGLMSVLSSIFTPPYEMKSLESRGPSNFATVYERLWCVLPIQIRSKAKAVHTNLHVLHLGFPFAPGSACQRTTDDRHSSTKLYESHKAFCRKLPVSTRLVSEWLLAIYTYSEHVLMGINSTQRETVRIHKTCSMFLTDQKDGDMF